MHEHFGGRLTTILLFVSIFAWDAQAEVAKQLDEIVEEYLGAKSQGRIGDLVALDGKLRRLLEEPWRRSRQSFDREPWKPSWSAIGVYVGHYSEALEYSGKVLLDAHQIDPSSKYRQYTLFSAILGERHELGEMPDVQVARQYLREFPDGPFVDAVLIILGDFYNDLFKLLKNLPEHKPGYIYDCFAKYVETGDLHEQANEARRLSIQYYSDALARRLPLAAEWAETKELQQLKTEMEQGNPTGWHFCAD